ncbi:MAG: DNA polymerase III subunit delta [Candidatus Improbicoccus devescovinae]|nr:MAG: DNA polymerase III subunit delta [Candidatus Improbicoccus devescovinae]
MAKISCSILKENIKLSKIDNLYYFYGENNFLIKKFTKQIKDIILKQSHKLNFFIFDFKEPKFDFKDLILTIETLPFNSEKKIILVKNIKFNDLESFFKKILDIPKFAIIILENNIKQRTKSNIFLEKIIKTGTVVEFPQITDLKILGKQIIIWAKEFGKHISVENANFLIQKYGNNMDILYNNIKRMSNSCTENGINKTDIENFLLTYTTPNIFDINKLIIEKNLPKIFEIINLLLTSNSEEANKIFSVISFSFIEAYQAKLALKYSINLTQAAKDLNYVGREFVLKNANYNTQNINENKIKKCIKIILESELIFKTSNIPVIFLLEEMFIKILL